MEITWLGHACFRLRSRELVIVTDPYRDEGWGYPPLSTTADLVTISNDHPHHAHTPAIAGQPRVVGGPGEYEIGGALIWGVRTSPRPAPDPLASVRNTAYVIQIEELTVCHLGDLAQPLSTEQLTHVKDSSVLLVPVGGGCTIGAAEAGAVVAQIEPRVIIPMHYATEHTRGHLTLDEVERFCREMGASEVTSQSRLSVTAATLPHEPSVVLLEPRR